MARTARLPHPASRGARAAAGFALIEVLVGLVVLTIAVLGHLSSVGSAHRHAKAVEERALAMTTLERLVERLRADPDWVGLWGRLRVYTQESKTDEKLRSYAHDSSLRTYPYTAYYSDLNVPTELRNCTFLVQVPVVSPAAGTYQLREDMDAPRYGLPYDLNGDGKIDSLSHHADYRLFPIVVRIRWEPKGQDVQEITIPTWLRGER